MTICTYTFPNGITTGFPTAECVEDLKVGHTILDCFGHEATVSDIRARGVNFEGRPYVMVILQWGAGSLISESLTADTMQRHVGLVSRMTSAEINVHERQARLKRRVQL